jgi:predicted kinase
MMDKRLYVMVGLPGSGKSTKAWEWVKANNFTYVSRDNVRDMLGMNYSTQAENVIKRMVCCLIEAAFLRNETVVVDATHLTEKSRRYMIELAKRYKAEPLAIVMNTSYETCFMRNSKRDYGRVPINAIRRLAETATMPKKDEGFSKIYVYNELRRGEDFFGLNI